MRPAEVFADVGVHPSALAERAVEVTPGREPVGAERPPVADLELTDGEDLPIGLQRQVLDSTWAVLLAVGEELAGVEVAVAGEGRIEPASARRRSDADHDESDQGGREQPGKHHARHSRGRRLRN